MENLATFKVTPSAYQHVVDGSQTTSASYQDLSGVAYKDIYARKTSSGKLFTVRTSDKSFESFSSSVSASSYLSPIGNGSFVAMHGDVSASLMPKINFSAQNFSIGFPTEGEDYVPPTGELDPEFASPVGDVLIPMLLFACAYAVVRFFKNRKMSKQVNSQNV